MRRLLNYIDKNLLLKIASLNSVAVLTRVIVGFLTSKAIAYYVGPSGMAIVGNLRDFISSTRSFASLGFYNGIVKYVAEFRRDGIELAKTISTVLYSVLLVSILISILLVFNAANLSILIFEGNLEFKYAFYLLAVAVPFYSINLVIMAVLNGTSRFKFLLHVSIIGHILTGAITLFLIWQKALQGAIVALVLSELIVLIIILFGIRGKKRALELIGYRSFNFNSLKNLGAFSAMTLFTAATLPLTYVFIRNYISNSVGLDEAGYWEAMNRISNYYLMFISSLLSLYILPRFAEVKTSSGFRREIINFYKTIMPIFILGLAVLYLLRNYVILVIFTDQFLSMENLFFWQMIGDIVKVLSLVISYQFLAKKMLWPYIISEGLSITILITSSIYFIDRFGVVGATIAHTVTYVIYFLVLVVIFRKALFGKDYEI